jgi:hypothetical protein
MGIISVAPELGVALSVEQWLDAYRFVKTAGKPYTMSHGFFLNMGGVILREATLGSVAEIGPGGAVAEGEQDDSEKTASATIRADSHTGYIAEFGMTGSSSRSLWF